MLTFCEKCGNIMSLKEKNDRTIGQYECRGCGLTRSMRVEKLEIIDDIF